tara:strand:+ start:1571 stop:1903 length:333 start_codon:yes stop_codon:yes gene_type:complete
MKFVKKIKKRKFIANKKTNLLVSDVGKIILQSREHLTIETKKRKNEICAMEWGFYLTPSINQRLKKQNFEVYLVKNKNKKKFIVSVLNNKKKAFHQYAKKEGFVSIRKLK